MFWLYSACQFTQDYPLFAFYLLGVLVCFFWTPHKDTLLQHQVVLGVWSSTKILLTYQGLHYKRKMTLPFPEASVITFVCVFLVCVWSGLVLHRFWVYCHNHCVYSSACPSSIWILFCCIKTYVFIVISQNLFI